MSRPATAIIWAMVSQVDLNLSRFVKECAVGRLCPVVARLPPQGIQQLFVINLPEFGDRRICSGTGGKGTEDKQVAYPRYTTLL